MVVVVIYGWLIYILFGFHEFFLDESEWPVQQQQFVKIEQTKMVTNAVNESKFGLLLVLRSFVSQR